MVELSFSLILASSLGCGLIGGVFFAFSTFVMQALARLPAAQGIAAMQAINIAVINRWFMTAFIGTALIGILAAVLAVLSESRAAIYCLAGSALYLLGVILVTGRCNVPLNNRLAAAAPREGRELWAHYLDRWTKWNHVRTAAALAAAICFMLALA